MVSHWILDFVTHRPDLPLWPQGPKVGLSLWDSIPGTLVVEGSLFLAALVMYVRATTSKDRTGKWALVGLCLFTTLVWVSQPWSPPPPSATAVASVSLLLWLLPFWAAWIERHRANTA